MDEQQMRLPSIVPPPLERTAIARREKAIEYAQYLETVSLLDVDEHRLAQIAQFLRGL